MHPDWIGHEISQEQLRGPDLAVPSVVQESRKDQIRFQEKGRLASTLMLLDGIGHAISRESLLRGRNQEAHLTALVYPGGQALYHGMEQARNLKHQAPIGLGINRETGYNHRNLELRLMVLVVHLCLTPFLGMEPRRHQT